MSHSWEKTERKHTEFMLKQKCYITCSRKKSRPKVSLIICEKCSRKRRCPDYKNCIEPSLFPRLTKRLQASIKRHKIKESSTQKEKVSVKPEQMYLGFKEP
ncbi:MAG: hypothetical protein JRJ23_06065 [Deltaproteobacteria bacterium]|nr:hypothetical protein [Deltaproteobacteria bacterium]